MAGNHNIHGCCVYVWIQRVANERKKLKQTKYCLKFIPNKFILFSIFHFPPRFCNKNKSYQYKFLAELKPKKIEYNKKILKFMISFLVCLIHPKKTHTHTYIMSRRSGECLLCQNDWCSFCTNRIEFECRKIKQKSPQTIYKTLIRIPVAKLWDGTTTFVITR